MYQAVSDTSLYKETKKLNSVYERGTPPAAQTGEQMLNERPQTRDSSCNGTDPRGHGRTFAPAQAKQLSAHTEGAEGF